MSQPLDVRIARLERMLGLDANSPCQGSPEFCGDLCIPKLCPSAQNPLVSIIESIGSMQHQIAALRTMLWQIARKTGVQDIPKFQARSELLSHLQSLYRNHSKITSDLNRMGEVSASSAMIDRTRMALSDVEEEIRGVMAALGVTD